METTFVIRESELDNNFLKLLKKLFKHTSQLQITVAASEDFGLLQKESPEEYLKRLGRCLADLEKGGQTVTFTEDEFNDELLRHL